MAQNNNSVGNRLGLANVLIARFSAIGDVAMTVPVIYSACRCYPDVRFILVTRAAMTSIFVNAPENLIVEGVDLKADGGPGGMRRLVAAMKRKYNIDVFVDLHDVLRTRLMGIFCRLSGIKVSRINKARSRRRALTRRHNKTMLPLTSQRARYRETFYRIGLPISERFDGLFDGHGKSDPETFACITSPKTPGTKWIGIAPFAAHKGKIYPPELMRKVVEQLAKADNTKIFLLGGGNEEKQILENWAAEIPHVHSLAGKKYGFAIELALFNHLDVMVTMDSANMHLGSIASTPTISIWGATHPYCGFKGWRQTESDAIQMPLTCRPCSVFGDKPCHNGDYLCLTTIKPDIIVKKVLAKINSNG